MTREYARAFILVAAWTLFAVIISKMISHPLEPLVMKPRIVKTILIDPDSEIEKQENWR